MFNRLYVSGHSACGSLSRSFLVCPCTSQSTWQRWRMLGYQYLTDSVGRTGPARPSQIITYSTIHADALYWNSWPTMTSYTTIVKTLIAEKLHFTFYFENVERMVQQFKITSDTPVYKMVHLPNQLTNNVFWSNNIFTLQTDQQWVLFPPTHLAYATGILYQEYDVGVLVEDAPPDMIQ